jgi:hypothetical protein
MRAEFIARALGGRRSGAGWVARCPAHPDDTPSMSVRDTGGPITALRRELSTDAGALAAYRRAGPRRKLTRAMVAAGQAYLARQAAKLAEIWSRYEK